MLLSAAIGCETAGVRNEDLSYAFEPGDCNTYVGEETKVAHSNYVQETPDDVRLASEPRTIKDRRDDTIRELTLADAIQIALMNNKIVQTATQGQVGSKAIFNNPDNIASVYDQAIAETGVLFGRRGVEAALSDFDATLRTTMTYGRSRRPLSPSSRDSLLTTSISKQFATGASLQFFNNWSYTDSRTGVFRTSYSGTAGLSFRQPLMAGAGTEFTRIAGPVNPNFGAITGVSQGVLIARINSDISLANFETSVRNSIRDVQNVYWDLYLAYRVYDTNVALHRSAHQTWKEAKIKLDVGTLKAADEAQALEQFYSSQAQVEQSLNRLYKAETSLRRLLGLQLNDGEVIRPADAPVMAEFQPDWRTNLAEALTRRVEMRRQKWNIRSLQLQLKAAKNLVRPQLDLVTNAQLDGFGDDLLGTNPNNFGNAYDVLGSGDFGGWNVGVEYRVPLGFRSATAQVTNYELRVTKAKAVLAQIEREIAHDVTTAIQDLVANQTSASTNLERLTAARRRVRLLEFERREGTTTLDLVLRAQASLAQAENDYYARIIDYNKAMISLEFAKGSLLPSSGIQLAEGGWEPCAYQDAYRRAQERAFAIDNPNVDAAPAPFASALPMGSPQIAPPLEMSDVIVGEDAVVPPTVPHRESGDDNRPEGDADKDVNREADRAEEISEPTKPAPAAPVQAPAPPKAPAAVLPVEESPVAKPTAVNRSKSVRRSVSEPRRLPPAVGSSVELVVPAHAGNLPPIRFETTISDENWQLQQSERMQRQPVAVRQATGRKTSGPRAVTPASVAGSQTQRPAKPKAKRPMVILQDEDAPGSEATRIAFGELFDKGR